MARTKKTPYFIPSAWRGDELKASTQKYDIAFLQAMTELAQEESKKYGRRIGVAAILLNLATRNNSFYRDQRAKVRKRYNELKQQETINDERTEEEQAIATEFQ